MREIKLTIDGKEAQLTDEQLKALGVESNKRINPFETVVRFEDYYSVEKNNEVYAYMDTGSLVDNQLYDAQTTLMMGHLPIKSHFISCSIVNC